MKYVLSDIHGNIKNWNSILEQISLTDSDELYVLGDVIDRGEHGTDILKQIISMKNVHMLLGNHEYMMLDALGAPYDNRILYKRRILKKLKKRWYDNGGKVTYRSFLRLSKPDQAKLICYLKKLPLNITMKVHGNVYRLCHAAIEELCDSAEVCVWDRDSICSFSAAEDVKIIFGHTPTVYFQPNKNPLEIYRNGSIIGIDCGSGLTAKGLYHGRIACLRLDDEEVFYSG